MKKLLLTYLLSAVYVLTASAQTRWMNPLEQGENIVHGRWWNSELRDNFHRLTPRAESKVRGAVWRLSKQSAGLSICFHTNAPSIKVRYGVKGGLNMFHMPTTGVSGVDLYATDANGRLRWCASKFNLSFKDTINYEFKDLTYFTGEDRGYDFELFLPLYNEVSWMEIGVEEGRELRFIQPLRRSPLWFMELRLRKVLVPLERVWLGPTSCIANRAILSLIWDFLAMANSRKRCLLFWQRLMQSFLSSTACQICQQNGQNSSTTAC